MGSASGEYQCDVILLVSRAQRAYLVRDSFYSSLAGLIAVVSQPFNEVLLTEFFASVIHSFGNAVCVKGEQVSGRKFEVGELALPLPEEPTRVAVESSRHKVLSERRIRPERCPQLA